MGKFVEPRVYWVGYQVINGPEVERYLQDSGNEDFLKSIEQARKEGLTDAEILCSIFAKLCYKSLTLGHNENISRVRDIEDNLRNCFDVGHGSVFEHVNFNFIVANCSRIFTHEQVRHRPGAAYSQNSGRFIRLDKIDIVFDPILNPIRELCREKQIYDEEWYYRAVDAIGLKDIKNFNQKKKITSGLRRFAPDGLANEIGISLNLRSIRHIVMLRTSRHAEWEMRKVYEQVYFLLKSRHKTMFYGAKEEVVEDIIEITGMRLQPYEKTSAELLEEFSEQQLEEELAKRHRNKA